MTTHTVTPMSAWDAMKLRQRLDHHDPSKPFPIDPYDLARLIERVVTTGTPSTMRCPTCDAMRTFNVHDEYGMVACVVCGYGPV